MDFECAQVEAQLVPSESVSKNGGPSKFTVGFTQVGLRKHPIRMGGVPNIIAERVRALDHVHLTELLRDLPCGATNGETMP